MCKHVKDFVLKDVQGITGISGDDQAQNYAFISSAVSSLLSPSKAINSSHDRALEMG